MNLEFFTFNNYYNRIIKKYNTITEYETIVPASNRADYSDINFNPNDGIDTEIIVDTKNFSDTWVPDYLVVYDGTALANFTIKSRWFVIEWVRLRNGQYKATIHRDVIADFYDNVLAAPIFIEKAFLSSDNPLIFNNEDMTYNQIKKSEELLKDETGSAWLVGYIASNYAGGETIHAEVETLPDITVNGISNYTYYGVNCKGLTRNILKFKDYYYPIFPALYHSYLNNFNLLTTETELKYLGGQSTSSPSYGLNLSNQSNIQNCFNDISARKNYFKTINSNFASTITGYQPDSYIAVLLQEAGKTIYDSATATYYKVQIDAHSYANNTKDILVNQLSTYTSLQSLYDTVIRTYTSYPINDHTFSFEYDYTAYQVRLVQITQPTANRQVTIPTTANRKHLWDAPYDMFCIPYSDDLKIYNNNAVEITSTHKADALAIATAIAKSLSTSCYDIQLLPYCPIRAGINNGKFDVHGLAPIYIEDGQSNKCSVMFFCEKSEFEFNIYKEISIYRPGHISQVPDILDIDASMFPPVTATVEDGECKFTIDVTGTAAADITIEDMTLSVDSRIQDDSSAFYPYYNKYTSGANTYLYVSFQTSDSDKTIPYFDFDASLEYLESAFTPDNPLALDVKIENETSFYRLSSPNFASSFNVNVAKNNGIEYFNVDCNYKPYTPYIHINPNWKNLYGSDYNDPRGLILSGDFSITMMNDAWESYQLQNKNYQLAFDRQIESIDLKNSIAKKQDIFNAVAGSLTGAAAGAVAGAKLGAGNPIATGAGAIIGAGASVAGGIMDVNFNEKLRTDARDLTIDQFGYQLGNIQALPYTINKLSAFNKNFKIWPVLEHYDCTDVEKEALKNKIKYNGMTVMTIGKIQDYIYNQSNQFIKGRLIRLEGIADDFHTADVISQELYKGVYF